MKIRKAVFPVAGLGTRFLPATKAMPKEMLTVVDRPLIQHVVDEAREAGIDHFIFVTGRNKGVIEDHFDRQFELELTLNERGKREELDALAQHLPGQRVKHQLGGFAQQRVAQLEARAKSEPMPGQARPQHHALQNGANDVTHSQCVNAQGFVGKHRESEYPQVVNRFN